MMRFSIVTPTFQRRHIVRASIDTALAFARATSDAEVIVVDDASSDGTVEVIRAAYPREIESGQLVVLQRLTNGGAAAAKNDGAQIARGDWLIFLDSDDQLLPIASQVIAAFAAQYKTAPVLFFRCEDETGNLVGPAAPAARLDLDTLLRRWLPGGGLPGECLAVVSRAAFLAHPYDEDLRGFEPLAYLRMVQCHGPALLSEAAVRRYDTTGADRLSTLSGRLRRADQLARGFARMRAEFGSKLGLQQQAALVLRIVCYRMAAIIGFGR
jgi:glycosyltransferase involved in cell wall biosynthesis